MRLAPFPALLLAAGCAAPPTPYAPIRDVAYSAIGAEPFWLLTIGDNRIVFRAEDLHHEFEWPRTLPRREGETWIWRSGTGEGEIVIEARPGPCTARDGRIYQDNVIVQEGGRTLHGCGGRLVRRGRS